MRLFIALVLTLPLASCAITPTLEVVLITDLSPGREIARTRVVLLDGDTVLDDQVSTFVATRVLGQAGAPIAELRDLGRPYRVDFVAQAPDGRVLAHRVIARAADGPSRITILLGRACLGVECADACHDGRCVSSQCFEESPDACGPAECEDASDCPAPTVPCTEVFCSRSGTCFAVAVPVRCEEGEVCDFAVGCRVETVRPRTDGGAGDAAPLDAGVEDAATSDGGPADASDVDAGDVDASDVDASDVDASDVDAS